MILVLLLIIIYISFISLGLPDSSLGCIWPSIYEGIEVPISYAGVIAMIVSGGTIVSSFFSEKAIRRLGTGLVTVISVFMTAAALFGFSISRNFAELCIFSIPLGLGAGSVDAALNNYVALHYKAKHMSWLHCFWGIGATTGPIIISYWLLSGQWRMGYRSISIIQFVLVAILIISLPLWKKAFHLKTKEEQTTEPSINEKENLDENGVLIPKRALSLKELLKLPGAKAALTAFFCYCSVEATAGLWGSSFLVKARGVNAQTAAQWIALFYFGITFGRFLSGFITLRLNQRQMIRLGQGILALGILLLLIPGTNLFLLPSFFLIGLGCAPIYPSLLHATPLNFGSHNSQALMGIQMACAYIGSTIMPPIFGFLASVVGYQLFMFYLGIILVLMIIMVERLNKSISMKTEV